MKQFVLEDDFEKLELKVLPKVAEF